MIGRCQREMQEDRTPIHTNGPHPRTRAIRVAGWAATATTATALIESRTRPYGYRNDEYSPTRHTRTTIAAKPIAPAPSRIVRAPVPIFAVRDRLGHTIARATPNNRPKARVSVPS